MQDDPCREVRAYGGAAADCTTDQTCTTCGVVLTAALGHTAGETVTENENTATCTEAGSYDSVIYCTVCNAEISRKTVIIGALGHDYQSTVIAPTCTEGGYTIHLCSRCSDYYTDGNTAAAGHTFGGWTTVSSATCEDNGLEERTCIICGEVENNHDPASGHTWDSIYTVDKAATCTTDGSKSIHCSVCNAVKDSEVIPATGHTYVLRDAVAATCTTTGLTEGAYCSVCNEVFQAQQTIPALGHNYLAVTTNPSCTEAGYTTYTCTRCKESYTADETSATGHTPGAAATCTTAQTCTVCGTVLAEAAGHTSGEAVKENETPATCTEPGSYDSVIYCKVCGIEISRETITVKATRHTVVTDPAQAATCTESGLTEGSHCGVCGEVLTAQTVIPSNGHTYHDIVTEPTCTSGGYITHTCIICGYSYTDSNTDASGHAWGEWETVAGSTCESAGYQKRICQVCGEIEEKGLSETGHIWDTGYTIDKEATCTTDGSMSIHCLVCGAVKDSTVIPATGHDFADYISNKDAGCTEDGTKTAICSNGCGATDTEEDIGSALGHDYTKVVTEPTCTSGGYTTYTCTRCAESYEADYTEAAGHSFGGWVDVSSSSCGDEGLQERTCVICGEIETNHTPSNGHTWEADFTIDQEATCTTDGSRSIHCSVCGAVKDSEIIPATGHAVVATEAVAATCTETGYTAGSYCPLCGTVFSGREGIPATGHSYGSPVFTWASDGTSCTATFSCINDGSHVETVTAEISSASETTLLASVSFEGETYTSTFDLPDSTGTEGETGTESETPVESETSAESKTPAETETETSVETGSETEPETIGETEEETSAESETEIASETEKETSGGNSAGTESETETETSKETESETETETSKETESETETETSKETESETEALNETDTELEGESSTQVPSTESETVTERETSSSPQTGDSSPVVLLIVIMMISVMVVTEAMIYRKRRNRRAS